MRCDSSHASPPCPDPYCHRRGEQIQQELEETIAWAKLRTIVDESCLEANDGSGDLRPFFEEHWSGSVPLQSLIALQDERLRRAYREIDRLQAANEERRGAVERATIRTILEIVDKSDQILESQLYKLLKEKQKS